MKEMSYKKGDIVQMLMENVRKHSNIVIRNLIVDETNYSQE